MKFIFRKLICTIGSSKNKCFPNQQIPSLEELKECIRKSSCNGDSGGSLLYYESGRYSTVGVGKRSNIEIFQSNMISQKLFFFIFFQFFHLLISSFIKFWFWYLWILSRCLHQSLRIQGLDRGSCDQLLQSRLWKICFISVQEVHNWN